MYRDSSMYSARYSDRVEGSPPPSHPCIVKQWITKVVSYSSQYNHTGWSANQILGEPKVFPSHGDIPGAWATSVWNTPQFIEVEFETTVRLSSIHIYETLNPGSIVKVKGRESSGPWTLLWQTEHPVQIQGSRIFSPKLREDAKMVKINQLRMELDMTSVLDWSELDAVQLVGVRDGTAAPIDDTKFVDDMSNLVNNTLHSDIKLNIDGRHVCGHKAILATRSPYLARMFQTNRDAATLEIPTLTFDDVKTVLHFLYTNHLPQGVSMSTLVTMCKASSMFEVPELKSAAVYSLVEWVKCDNVVAVFLQARDDPQLDDVKSMCQTFMASNLKEMSQVPSFKLLTQNDMVSVVREATNLNHGDNGTHSV